MGQHPSLFKKRNTGQQSIFLFSGYYTKLLSKVYLYAFESLLGVILSPPNLMQSIRSQKPQRGDGKRAVEYYVILLPVFASLYPPTSKNFIITIENNGLTWGNGPLSLFKINHSPLICQRS